VFLTFCCSMLLVLHRGLSESGAVPLHSGAQLPSRMEIIRYSQVLCMSISKFSWRPDGSRRRAAGPRAPGAHFALQVDRVRPTRVTRQAFVIQLGLNKAFRYIYFTYCVPSRVHTKSAVYYTVLSVYSKIYARKMFGVRSEPPSRTRRADPANLNS
jgi:hypothetical protein